MYNHYHRFHYQMYGLTALNFTPKVSLGAWLGKKERTGNVNAPCCQILERAEEALAVSSDALFDIVHHAQRHAPQLSKDRRKHRPLPAG